MKRTSSGSLCPTGRGLAHFLAVTTLAVAVASPARALERLEPPTGCYLGISMDNGDTISRLGSRLGLRPVVYCEFFEFPLPTALRAGLTSFLDQVRTNGGIAMITLKPYRGLTNVSAAACLEFAQLCASQETQRIGGILVRLRTGKIRWLALKPSPCESKRPSVKTQLRH